MREMLVGPRSPHRLYLPLSSPSLSPLYVYLSLFLSSSCALSHSLALSLQPSLSLGSPALPTGPSGLNGAERVERGRPLEQS